MPVEVLCPNPLCGERQRVPEGSLGRSVRCRQCGERFMLDAQTTDGHGQRAQTIIPANSSHGVTPVPDDGDRQRAGKSADPNGSGDPSANHGLPNSFARFEVRAVLGAGVAGVVYRAYDPLLAREVALKVPHEAALGDPGAIARFLREPKAAAHLRHPHIVPVYDAGAEAGRYYIASAYIEGRTLEQVIQDGRPEFRCAARIVLDLAEALEYAHARGVIHRDVKPANIMLDARGDALLMDFGLARLATSADKLTHDGTLLGTPAYMAPEQAGAGQAGMEFGEVGPASDQYSLGVVFYELLCGERPFHGPPAVTIYNVLHQAPKSPRAVARQVPRDLETICLKAMARHPSARYASCGDLAADLRCWLDDQPIVARRMGAVERTLRWARKRPALAALVVLIVALAAFSTVAAAGLQASRASLRYLAVETERQRGEAERHAKRAQAALTNLRHESETRARLSKDLADREQIVAESERQIVRAREELSEKDESLAAKRRKVQDREEALSLAEKERQAAEELAETKRREASKAAERRDDAVESADVRRLAEVEILLSGGEKQEALIALEKMSEESRPSWEWRILHALANGSAKHWEQPQTMHDWAFRPDGKALAIVPRAEKRATVFLLDTLTGKTSRWFETQGENTWDLAFHPAGDRLAVAHRDSIVEYGWSGKVVRAVRRMRLPSRDAQGVCYNSAGSSILSAGFHGDSRTRGVTAVNAYRIRGETGTELEQLTLPEAGKYARNVVGRWVRSNLVSHPDLALNPNGEPVLFYEIYTGVPGVRVLGLNSAVQFDMPPSKRVLFHPNFDIAVGKGTAVADTSAAHARQQNRVIALRLAEPISFSPDGKRLACDTGTSLQLWNTESPNPQEWKKVVELEGALFGGPVVDISPDWRHLLVNKGEASFDVLSW